MVASPRQRLILPLAPLGAGVMGGLTALVFLALPSGALESLVVDSGIAAIVAAAQPPLHFTARAALALAGGGTVALLTWVALFVAVGTRSVVLHGALAGGAEPTQRRADAHPDAPPRQPVFANRDLGTPFLEIRAEPPLPPIPAAIPAPADAIIEHRLIVPATMGPAGERPLPINLDLPLAAFDPGAIPLKPGAWSAARPAPIARERAEAPERAPDDRVTIPFRMLAAQMIDLAPNTAPAPRPATDTPASIRSLLDRLERSVAQRDTAPPAPSQRRESIRETLDTLRTLATRAG